LHEPKDPNDDGNDDDGNDDKAEIRY